MNPIKNIIYVLAALTLFYSCEQAPDGKLGELKAERDSLKTVRAELDEKIFAIEDEIAILDSTTEKKLVTVVEAKKSLFKHYFEVYGNVESDRSATINAESNGIIQRIHVQEGAQVKRGQIIAEQDNQIINSNIQEVRTQLELADELYKKQKRLWDQNVGSEVQYLEAKNRKESLESSLATLQEQKNKATIRAPFNGVVDKIFPKEGELASPASPVVRLVNLDKLYITADVSERYVGDLTKGDSVEVIVNRKDTIVSAIERIGKYINPTNRSFEIRVNIDEANTALRPNSLVVLRINDHSEQDAIVVPSNVVMQDGKGLDYVYVIDKDEKNFNVAVKKKVKLGMSYKGQSVVDEGVSPSQNVVDKGSRNLRDGDRIEISKI